MRNWSRGCARLLLLYLLMVAFMGCNAEPNAGEKYLDRLAGALELADFAVADTLLVGFPAANTLAIDRLPEKINLLEFLQVTRCDLGALVGERNSSLGRVQTPSQRWLYDARLVNGLRDCRPLAKPLQDLLASREAALGIAAFNALFSGKEWHAFATPPLELSSASTSGAAVVLDTAGVERSLLALTAMVNASRDGYLAESVSSELEEHLAQLRFSSALGIQRRLWREQSVILERATRMLHSAIATNPGCRNGKPTQKGITRKNVFEQFYVSALQPELARQGQPDRGWVRAVSVLVSAAVAASARGGAVPPKALVIKRWHERVLGAQSQSEYSRWKTALTAHSRAWQRQLSICGLMPGKQ